MKKFFLFLLLITNFFITTSSIKNKYTIENLSFFEEISKYQSFQEDKYNKYLEESKSFDNIVFILNKVNYPNFFTNNNSYKSFDFEGGIFVNKNYFLTENYVPESLVPITVNKIIRKGETMQADKEASIALTKLFNDANNHNINLTVYSAYRSYQKQLQIYNTSLDKNYVAKPGHSEHQTGLAFDISTLNAGLSVHFENSIEYLYLTNNAYKFGFIERYPKNKTDITNYPYESWHYRYVGVPIATIIYNEQITLEEYIYKYVELPITF